MHPFRYILFIILMSLLACSKTHKPLYKSDAFIVFPNRVEQGEYTAVAKSDTYLLSNYQSPKSLFFSPIIQFKFSINGGDNEMPYNVNHQVNIYPEKGDSVVIVSTVFGKQAHLRSNLPHHKSLPPNTKVLFKLDFRPVLEAFRKKGFYEDPLGNKIFKNDFKGIFIAGSAYPLSWDFENLTNNPNARLTDDNKDGIFEIALNFNDYNPSSHLSSQWTLTNNISKYPRFTSDKPLLNAIYNMSLDEMVMLLEDDGTFRTGKEWAGVWTRDISYSVFLSLAMVEPEICKNSLMRKVKNKRIIQDTGTGGAWPVSSDRVVWAIAAWEVYKYTGDKNWLTKAYEIISNSVTDDEKTVFNQKYGLFSGESSFLDWRKQSYPLWMEPSDIYTSLNLGTNMVFYQTLKILDLMANELNINQTHWMEKAYNLKKNINNFFWIPEKGYYGQYLYGDRILSLSPKPETLGEALSILFEVADNEKTAEILANVPNLPFGTPCFYPQIPNIPPYHNNGIWPFVQAYWTLAASQGKHSQLVQYGYASILRQAALFLTNKENFVAENGDFAGTEINSDRQLWSVAGQLAMNFRVLFGIQLQANELDFNPVIPKSFEGKYLLEGFKYREAELNISVEGFGTGVEEFYLDGILLNNPVIKDTLKGVHNIRMVLNRREDEQPLNNAQFLVSPETPKVTISHDTLKWENVDGAILYKVIRNGIFWGETSNTFFLLDKANSSGEYQVIAFNKHQQESFLSEPVTVDGNHKIILEAENFNLNKDNKHPGYLGTGYIDFNKSENTQLTVNTYIFESGRWYISFRYANGSGPVNTDNKCAIRTLSVNGHFISSIVFPQRGKNEWSNWGITNTLPLTLEKGTCRLVIDFKPFNENMNGIVNQFLLDQIILEKW